MLAHQGKARVFGLSARERWVNSQIAPNLLCCNKNAQEQSQSKPTASPSVSGSALAAILELWGRALELISDVRLARKMASLGRFELPTPCLGGRCSIHLSYRDAGRREMAVRKAARLQFTSAFVFANRAPQFRHDLGSSFAGTSNLIRRE